MDTVTVFIIIKAVSIMAKIVIFGHLVMSPGDLCYGKARYSRTLILRPPMGLEKCGFNIEVALILRSLYIYKRHERD